MPYIHWTKWSYYTGERKKIASASGNYEIRWSIEGQPQTIQRLNKDDPSGLIYVGKAENLQDRISKFFRCINAANLTNLKNFHSGAVTFLSFNFKQKINPKDLQYRYCQLPKDEIRASETRLLQEYVERYLDKPPLNTVIKR
jgi:hypothetical protein